MSGEESRRLGRWGENLAAKFLVGKGYRVLDRNWKCRFGELDLVAEGEGYLCFVEVKLRRTQRFGTGAEQVDQRKREKLRITAELYLQERPAVLQPRFDVIEVLAPNGLGTKNPKIRHIEGAF